MKRDRGDQVLGSQPYKVFRATNTEVKPSAAIGFEFEAMAASPALEIWDMYMGLMRNFHGDRCKLLPSLPARGTTFGLLI